MTRYNHFSERKYNQICFSNIQVGEKFRMNKWKGNRARRDLIMIKDSELAYHEFKSQKEYRALKPKFEVSNYLSKPKE